MNMITRTMAQIDEILVNYTEDKAKAYTPNVSLKDMIEYWTEKTASIIARGKNVRTS